MIWPLIHHSGRWFWRHRNTLTAGWMLLNLGLLHPLLCVLHCEILLRVGQPIRSGHVHAAIQSHAHHSSAGHRTSTAAQGPQPTVQHQECAVLPPAVYALVLSIPPLMLLVFAFLGRATAAMHFSAGQHLRPPIPPPLALLS